VTAPVLDVQGLAKHYPVAGGRIVRAVDDVSFRIAPGESVGLVGESGSGKTTVGLLVTRLVEATHGVIRFEGQPLATLPPAALRALRARLQIVFQNPWGALNPRMTIGRALEEPLVLHARLDPAVRAKRVRELADQVQLPIASLDRYPHELSGGQLQRVGIARAIANRPALVVLDEPTSSLDLSVRAGVLRLLADIRRETGLAMLFISHDLETVAQVTDRVLVMYLGRIVEAAPTRSLFAGAAHPYAQVLLSASLPPDPEARLARHVLTGEIPSPTAIPAGCAFHTRCPVAAPTCHTTVPGRETIDTDHEVACLRVADGGHRLAVRSPSPTLP